MGVETSENQTQAMEHAQIAKLITQHYSGLLHLIRSKLKDKELASDLLNEAIAMTLEHSNQGRIGQPGQVAGYVFKVTMNLLRNYRRNMDNRTESHGDAESMESLPFHDADPLESEQIKATALKVIKSLASSRDREIVKRFYLDEEEKQSICEALDLSPIQFTQVISRARQRMKLLFDSQGVKHQDFFSFFF